MAGVMDRHSWRAWLDQINITPVDHIEITRRCDGDCPAEVVVDSDVQVHREKASQILL